MSRTRRVALGAAMAVGALVLPCATGAQATTAHSVTVTMSARDASGIRPLDFPSGYISLRPDYPGGSDCLTSVGYGQQTRLQTCHLPQSQWYVTPLSGVDSRGGQWEQLQDINDGYCLDAEDDANGSPNTNGDHVNAWPCDGANQQRWYFWPIANGDWMIVSLFNTNKVLDARTSGVWSPNVENDPVQVWDHVSTPQQAWIVFPA